MEKRISLVAVAVESKGFLGLVHLEHVGGENASTKGLVVAVVELVPMEVAEAVAVEIANGLDV